MNPDLIKGMPSSYVICAIYESSLKKADNKLTLRINSLIKHYLHYSKRGCIKVVSKTSEDDASQSLLSRIRGEFSFIKGNFLILALSWLIMDFAREMPTTYYGLYVKALGGSAFIIGIIGSVSMIFQAIVQIPGGYLADKYGRRWLISTMTFGIALSYLFYAFAPTWQWLMVGAIIQSLCFIYRPALQAIIADSLPQDRRGMGFSIITLINSVSTTPSPLLAGWLFQVHGLVPSVRISYTLVMIAFFIAGVIRLRIKETVENPPKINIGEMVGSIPASIRESMTVWRKVPKSAFALFTTDILLMTALSLFMPIMVLYIVEDLGLPEVRWSLILTTLFVSMIVLSIPIGKIIDKVGKRWPLIAAYLLWIITIPLYVYGNFFRLFLAMILSGAIQITLMSASASLIADLVPQEHRGKVSGSSNFFSLIASSIGYLTSGYLYDNVSHTLPWWLTFACIVPCILIIILFVKEQEQ
jgi:MFS family permease